MRGPSFPHELSGNTGGPEPLIKTFGDNVLKTKLSVEYCTPQLAAVLFIKLVRPNDSREYYDSLQRETLDGRAVIGPDKLRGSNPSFRTLLRLFGREFRRFKRAVSRFPSDSLQKRAETQSSYHRTVRHR